MIYADGMGSVCLANHPIRNCFVVFYFIVCRTLLLSSVTFFFSKILTGIQLKFMTDTCDHAYGASGCGFDLCDGQIYNYEFKYLYLSLACFYLFKYRYYN